MALSLELERRVPGPYGTLLSYTIADDEEDVGAGDDSAAPPAIKRGLAEVQKLEPLPNTVLLV